LRLDQYSPQTLVGVLNKAPRPFDLVIIVFDAVRPDPTAFFDSFAKRDGFHDFVIPEIASLYKKLFYEEDESEKDKISKELTRLISGQALAIPLYQNIRTIYYPKEIKNLTVGRGFLEYPEVAEFRL
jgi:ABC-type transport system substrate-binding protein